MYGIWCEVSGGVTGYRCAWSKSNNEIEKFETLEAARAEAARRMEKTNGNPYRKADFSYSPRPLSN
ncbi:MAG: hypothetical protein NTX56_04045 [Proteobacteria bacterium]|nr:hypothetical protein [Pseudomonadota bacterium]